MCGTLDDPDALPPKGEFFCKARSKWMPEIPGMLFSRILGLLVTLGWPLEFVGADGGC